MRNERLWLSILIVISLIVGLFAVDLGDFDTFYAAGHAVLQGINPYNLAGYYSPIYVALAFAPVSLIPFELAFKLYAGLVFFTFGIAFYFLTKKRLGTTILLMCSPMPLFTAWYGNLEGWVLLGALLTPTVGIWLVMAKPQIGIVVAGLFIFQCWRAQSARRAAWLAAPVTLAFLLSFALGMWGTTPILAPWNLAIWPISMLIGVPATFMALHRSEMDLALFASPFLSPYLGSPSALAGLLPFLGRRWYIGLGAVIGTWIIVILWRLRI